VPGRSLIQQQQAASLASGNSHDIRGLDMITLANACLRSLGKEEMGLVVIGIIDLRIGFFTMNRCVIDTFLLKIVI